MLVLKIALLTIVLSLWAILLHAEMSREVEVPMLYKSASGVVTQKTEAFRKEMIKEGIKPNFAGATCVFKTQPIVSPADFAGVTSHAHLPAPAVFGGVRCISKMPSLATPETFRDVIPNFTTARIIEPSDKNSIRDEKISVHNASHYDIVALVNKR